MTINEDLKDYFSLDLGVNDALPQLEYEWLKTKTTVRGAIPDMWYAYLNALGYSGSILDMKYNLGWPFSANLPIPSGYTLSTWNSIPVTWGNIPVYDNGNPSNLSVRTI